MTNMGPTREPDDDGLFRGLFARREPSLAEPSMSPAEERLAMTLQEAVDERLEDGLRTLEEQATGLLREVATEVWRTCAKDVRPEQERIVTLLARDQAIRSLITSSDERFQTLAVKTARLEDHLNDLADSERRTREAMENSAAAIREIATSPTLHGVDIVRTQLEQVERHIAETFAHMDERDKHLSETVLTQVREHGELIANETSRIVESMQAYVQGGAEAVGRLAQRIEEHARAVHHAGPRHHRARPRHRRRAGRRALRADRHGPREGRAARPRAGRGARADRAPDRGAGARPRRADPLGLGGAPASRSRRGRWTSRSPAWTRAPCSGSWTSGWRRCRRSWPSAWPPSSARSPRRSWRCRRR